jgi:type II secretory pathway component PulJ
VIRGAKGFTLIEVLVGFLIAAVAIGGSMGVLSSSMRLTGKADRELKKWSEFEEVIQKIYADPGRLMDVGSAENIEDGGFSVEKRVVTEVETGELRPRNMHLMRVMLRKDGEAFEMSMAMPADFVLEYESETEVPVFQSFGREASQYDGWQGDAEFLGQWEDITRSYEILRPLDEPLSAGGRRLGGGAAAVSASPGGWADESYQSEVVEEDQDSSPENVAVPEGPEWKKNQVSQDEYFYVNTETGVMLRVFKDQEYQRWKTEWIH